ncbi:hypothetical protein ACXXDK_03720 [Deinococcus sp. PESE-38]
MLNLMGRVWSRLARALLAPDEGAAARREVLALRRAAGRVALGDDLDATMQDLTRQACAASTARTVTLLTPGERCGRPAERLWTMWPLPHHCPVSCACGWTAGAPWPTCR